MEQSALEPQDEVWVFTDEDGSRADWIRGQITSAYTNTVDAMITRGQVREEVKDIPWDRVIKYQPLSEQGMPDVTRASPEEFSEVFMVETLRKRFNSALPSMKAGPFLVTLRGDCVQGLDKDPALFARPKNEERPDASKTAEAVYQKCISEGAPQTMICTGMSGSGKSYTVREVLGSLASSGCTGSISSQVVKDTLNAAIVVLDAFSNASTTMNSDSSRSARGYSLFYDESGGLVGGKVVALHLDVGRLTRKPNGEGSFHIMQQLCYGAWPNEKEQLKLRSLSEYKLMENSPRSQAVVKKMASGYNDTRDAMGKLGLSMEEQEQLMQIVSGILALGNLSFTGAN